MGVIYDKYLGKLRDSAGNGSGGGGGSGGITSAEAEQIAKQVALPKNSAWTTTVGGYTLSFDGNGGFEAHYIERGGEDVDFQTTADYKVRIGAGGVELFAGNDADSVDAYTSVGLNGVAAAYRPDGSTDYASASLGSGTISVEAQGGVTANGSAITQASSSFDGTSLGIAELSGGVKYVCQSALTALSIGSAVPGCNGTIIFTVANGAIVTPPANVDYFGVTHYTQGAKYIMMVNDFAAVCNEAVVPGV